MDNLKKAFEEGVEYDGRNLGEGQVLIQQLLLEEKARAQEGAGEEVVPNYRVVDREEARVFRAARQGTATLYRFQEIRVCKLS